MQDSLGDRMKKYERAYDIRLPWRLPIILRLDGKAFHTFTRDAEKPFDSHIIEAMSDTATYLCEQLQGVKYAYVQSDEISILLYPWVTYESQPWYNNELQKLVSVSAGLASSYFTVSYCLHKNENTYADELKVACFDSRAFILPEHEVENYFIWRQSDWIRNSVSMQAQSLFSHKELQGKSGEEMKNMCQNVGHAWELLVHHLRHGRMIVRDIESGQWMADIFTPLFKENREYLKYTCENR